MATATGEVESQGRALADAAAEVKRLAGLAEQASSQRQETAERLIAQEETVQSLEVERLALEGRYAARRDDNERLGAMLEEQRAEIAASEVARGRERSGLLGSCRRQRSAGRG